MNKELQFLIYNTPQEDVKINVVIKDETIWLTQKAMAELFGVGVLVVSKHIKNIFEEGELSENTTVSKMETVMNRGFRGEVIGQHVKNILEEGDPDGNSVVKFFFTTVIDGKNYNTEHYNLDMIYFGNNNEKIDLTLQ